jgi:hypothetical protein
MLPPAIFSNTLQSAISATPAISATRYHLLQATISDLNNTNDISDLSNTSNLSNTCNNQQSVI